MRWPSPELRPLLTVLLTLAPLAAARGEDAVIESAEPPPANAAPALRGPAWFDNLGRDFNTFNLVSAKDTLSFHKPMFLLPYTFSPDYRNDHAEVIYQLSLKQQLFRRSLYFAYTQRSFWQLYDGGDSRPFRETDYNPELFLRFKELWGSHWGVDLGGDHESNGRPLPESRSWNRLYLAGYHENGNSLVYMKAWWRLPETKRAAPTDPSGDDNPDIEKFYGYAELHLQRRFGDGSRQLSLMVRANPATGNGALNLTWTQPFGDYAFWSAYLWEGYGESLLDYNRSITRIGLGFALAR